MKKIMLLAAILSAGILACGASCTHKSQTQAPTDGNLTCNEAGCPIKLPEAGSEVVSDVISEDNWQFTLPGSGWVPVKSPDDTIKVIFTNKESGTVVFFAKDPTTQTSNQYILNALRSFKAANTDIKSAKQVTINGVNYIMVTAQGTSRLIWTWITVRDSAGYVFTCAVDHMDAGEADQQRCQDIANTLQIR